MTRSRMALVAGIGIAVLYLAGAALSGRASPLARRPLLDGLAPPVPYRWVRPPPDLAASNKPPAALRFSVELAATGSRLGAFATSDGQFNLVLSEGAVPASQGQTSVAVSIEPVDPATLGPAPAGLVVAGNAYRIQASYRPSGGKVDALGDQSSVGLVYPLLATPIASPSGHLVLASADGRSWQRLRSTDIPGTHQVSAELGTTGYVAAAVPPAGAGGDAGGNGSGRVLLVATAVAALLVLAALLARRRLATTGPAAGRRPTKGPRARPGGTTRSGPARKPPGRNPARRRRRR
jgi:hypothetical protein